MEDREVPGSYYFLSFWRCSNCGKGVCGESESMFGAPKGVFGYDQFSDMYPKPYSNTAPDHTPDRVAADFREAVSSLKNSNCTAASLMARRAVERAAKTLGAKGGGLKDLIEFLEKRNLITQTLAAWAYEIRDIGVTAAHKDAITEKDARDAVNFAEMLFVYLFELPGRITERRSQK